MTKPNQTKQYQAGVIGYPIDHSLSPILHGYWLDNYGIDGHYSAVAVAPETLNESLRNLQAQGWQGCNVTIPHKEDVFKICDKIDTIAERIKAVNTLIFKEGGTIFGTNTDAYGFTENIRSHSTPKPATGCAIVLGAGGACRAIIVAIQDMGFSHIHLVNRTVSRAETLQGEFSNPQCTITTGDFDSVHNYMADCALLVNTTSLGMTGHDDLQMDISSLPTSAIVTDIVYNPLMTTLLKTAQQQGNQVVDGLGMLLYQAVPGFEAWFNHSKPQVTEDLRTHILKKMGS